MIHSPIEQIRHLMDNQDNIRNVAIVGNNHHGKSSIFENFVINQHAQDNTRKNEEKGYERSDIRSNIGILYYKCHANQPEKKDTHQQYLFSLIDSPGSERATSVLRISDGAIVVVEPLAESTPLWIDTILRQTVHEKIKPVLFINKIDRCINEYKLEGEALYEIFLNVIDNANAAISIYQSEGMGNIFFDPSMGNVIFGSARNHWAFTLSKFARLYSIKFGIEQNKMVQKLWGDNYFDALGKKWRIQLNDENGKPLKRAFIQFIMEPILKLSCSILEGKKENYEKMLKILNIELSQQDQQLPAKHLLRVVMNKWLPAIDCLQQIIVLHLPSPKIAQKHRTSYLYENPRDNACAVAMNNCGPKGPLMTYISMMIPTIDKKSFYALGRVFSGTIASGQKVRILGIKYKPGNKDGVYETNVAQTVLIIGRNADPIPDVPCGNIIALTGIDKYLINYGTITSVDTPQSYPIRPMKHFISPVAQVYVRPKNADDLPKFCDGFKKLAQSDPLAICSFEDTGEYIIAGCSKMHIENCLQDLENDYACCELIKSEFFPIYKECITETSSQTAMSKSANKFNRLYGTSEPLNQDLVNSIQNGQISENQNPEERSKRLVNQFDWQKYDTTKIWCFGPQYVGPNVVVDLTENQSSNEIKASVVASFQWVSKQGILCGENMRGIRFNIVDFSSFTDAIHRGGGQLIPAARRLYYALEILGKPTLLEPMALCQITTPLQKLGSVYKTLAAKRCKIIDENQTIVHSSSETSAYIPVSETIGFYELLRENTEGKAYYESIFDHWQKIEGLPYQDQKAQEIVVNIRKRKGLQDKLSPLENFNDKY